MGIVTMAILIIVIAIAGFVIYRHISVKKSAKVLSQKKFQRIQPLYDKLERGQTLTQTDVYEYAKNVTTREITYRLLKQNNLTDIFPKEFLTIEKAAESNLVNWLEFPTELDGVPNEIEHAEKVTIDFDGQNNFVHYHVFRFRIDEPHWAAKNDWMIGVVGPYSDDSQPYDHPHSTFSRLDSKLSPDEEARWVHQNISLKR